MNLQGKTVVVTGADGFIGSHLTEHLVAKGAKVRALSQYNSFNNWGWLEEIDCLSKIEVFAGDIRDAHFVKEITQGADVIFHLAALIAIPYSYIAPDSYVQTNVTGTLNVMKAALENKVSRVLHTSTSEVYGTARYVPIDENIHCSRNHPTAQPKLPPTRWRKVFITPFSCPWLSFGLLILLVRGSLRGRSFLR